MNPVQQKIPCVYVLAVKEELSNKRKYQSFSVEATRDLTEKSQRDNIASAKATEKLDGTCCLIDKFEGQPWLWARHDRKPSKDGERKFAQFKKSLQKKKENDNFNNDFFWDPSKDFKEVPAHWKPASRLEVINGVAMPDDFGHTPGWVPVQPASRQYCWHLTAVDYDSGLALILREDEEDSSVLVIKSQPLSLLCGQTCELIGTNSNGNPYKIGSKKCPMHVLVPHGSLSLTCPQPDDYDEMCSWFDSPSGDANVEGIVWHCDNGELHKLHRHHLNLKWPVQEPKLCSRKVRVQVDLTQTSVAVNAKKDQNLNLFSLLQSLSGHTFDSIQDLHTSIVKVNDTESMSQS